MFRADFTNKDSEQCIRKNRIKETRGELQVMGSEKSIQRCLKISIACFFAASFVSLVAHATEKKPRIIYPEKTQLDFEGARIEGEIRNPGELYFQRRQEEKFGSLVQPRTNFRRAILRDLMQTR